MAKPLVPCSSCARHVRASEAACPFCGSSLENDLSKVPGVPTSRLGRAALFAFGATVAVTAAGCGSSVTNTDASAQDVQAVDNGGMLAIYGAPAPDSGNPGARYGAVPPSDAG